MGVKYDFYQNPIPKGSNRKPRLHARVVTNGTTTTDQLAEIIHDRSTLTVGEVKAVLDSLSDLLLHELAYSRRVHMEGLGYFQLVLECPPIKTEKEIRAESIKVRTIVFRAEEKLKKKARGLRVERVRCKNKSKKYSDIEIDGLLTAHFLDHDHISTIQFCQLCGLTFSTGGRRLRKLIEENRLLRVGHRKSSVYMPVKGNYRR